MQNHFYFKLYKPSGYLSQFVNNTTKRKSKKLLGELHDFPPTTMAIGRLDQNTEGLLLLTTDGAYSYQINNGAVEKEYYAQLDGNISSIAIKKLQKGVSISVNSKSYITKKCKVQKIEKPNLAPPTFHIRDDRHGTTSWVSIIITEGKFRQVRKMTSAVGFPTLRLVRVRVGTETLENLNVGEVQEIEKLNL